MKKKALLLTFSFLLLASSLDAQQLYFLRATIGDYGYSSPLAFPPTQVIAFTPERDSLLHIYKDLTRFLPNNIGIGAEAIEFYPQYNVFVLRYAGLIDWEAYVLHTNNPSIVTEIPVRCIGNHKVSTFSPMHIINGHWAYRCTDVNASDEDFSQFRGLDFSLTQHFDMSASDFGYLHLTGAVTQRVERRPGTGRMYLPIVAGGNKNRPPFSVELPERHWVESTTYTFILVNDDQKTLVQTKRVNPVSDEDYGRWYATLYNKDSGIWTDVQFKGNSPRIMTYGHWLAGMVEVREDWEAGFDIGNRVSPGKEERWAINRYIENSFDEQMGRQFYRPGILFLFNTETMQYIEWETQQGDSKILLVYNEVVYYRVFDAIYRADIIDGERLDNVELLVRDNQIVPFIHWAFYGREMEICLEQDN